MQLSFTIFAVTALDLLSLASAHLPHHRSSAVPANSSANVTPHNFTFDQLYHMTTNFFDNFMYPKDVAEARLINATIWDDNVIGRVDATRDIIGRELNTEYAFGLWSEIALNPGSFTLLGIPETYNITHFTANQNIISASAIVNFNVTALDVVNPVEFLLWATFNKHGQISQYDVTFRYLQWQFDELLDIGKTIFNVQTRPEVQEKVTPLLAGSICTTEVKYCNGTNLQYPNYDACVDHLSNKIRFGQAYELGMNTLLCRMVHQAMVPIRPSVHCPHLGPTGGGFCNDDRTYTGTVTQPLYFQPFVPFGYANKNTSIAAE